MMFRPMILITLSSSFLQLWATTTNIEPLKERILDVSAWNQFGDVATATTDKERFNDLLRIPAAMTEQRATDIISLVSLLETSIAAHPAPHLVSLRRTIHRSYAHAFAQYIRNIADISLDECFRLRAQFNLLYGYTLKDQKKPFRLPLIALLTRLFMLKASNSSPADQLFEITALCQHSTNELLSNNDNQSLRPLITEFMQDFTRLSILPMREGAAPEAFRTILGTLTGTIRLCMRGLLSILDLPLHFFSAIPRAWFAGYDLSMLGLGVPQNVRSKPLDLYYTLARWPLRAVMAFLIAAAITRRYSNRLGTVSKKIEDWSAKNIGVPFDHGLADGEQDAQQSAIPTAATGSISTLARGLVHIGGNIGGMVTRPLQNAALTRGLHTSVNRATAAVSAVEQRAYQGISERNKELRNAFKQRKKQPLPSETAVIVPAAPRSLWKKWLDHRQKIKERQTRLAATATEAPVPDKPLHWTEYPLYEPPSEEGQNSVFLQRTVKQIRKWLADAKKKKDQTPPTIEQPAPPEPPIPADPQAPAARTATVIAPAAPQTPAAPIPVDPQMPVAQGTPAVVPIHHEGVAAPAPVAPVIAPTGDAAVLAADTALKEAELRFLQRFQAFLAQQQAPPATDLPSVAEVTALFPDETSRTALNNLIQEYRTAPTSAAFIAAYEKLPKALKAPSVSESEQRRAAFAAHYDRAFTQLGSLPQNSPDAQRLLKEIGDLYAKHQNYLTALSAFENHPHDPAKIAAFEEAKSTLTAAEETLLLQPALPMVPEGDHHAPQ